MLLFPLSISAQEPGLPKEEIYKAAVLEILEEGEKGQWEIKNPYQRVKLKFLDGPKVNQELEIEHGITFRLTDNQRVTKGDKVVLFGTTPPSPAGELETQYHIIDKYRLDKILMIVAVFIILVVSINRLKGLGSILGLVFSFFVILKFIVPQILEGKDPVQISIIGSSIIMLVTLFLAHGFNKKTVVALVSTTLTLVITGLLAAFFVNTARLTGLGSEAAYGLTFGAQTSLINLKGLLLGGIIIGTLGVLDDVTTTQSSTIFELKKLHPKISFKDLFTRGLNVGKDHISSVVNTLVLAYTGAALPIFILIVLNPSNQPLWFLMNSENITEEIIRSLGGSISLILAVPLTTLLAAWTAFKDKKITP